MLERFHKLTEFLATWHIRLFSKGVKAVQKAIEVKSRELVIEEENTAIKPTKYKPTPPPEVVTKTSHFNNYTPPKKAEEPQHKKRARMEKTGRSPVYFKLGQPGAIPENTELFYMGKSRVDGFGCYEYWGNNIDTLKELYYIEELHNL